MTGRERVYRAVRHQVTDRVPMDYCTRDDVAANIRRHMGLPDQESLLRKLGVDIRKLAIWENVPSFEARSGGKRLITHPDGSVENVWGVVQMPSEDGLYMEMVRGPFYETDDLDSFDWPSLDCIESVESIKARIDAFEGQYSIFGSFNNPFKCCWHMRGLENYLCDTVADPDFAIALWEKTAEYELEKAKRFVLAGGDVAAFTGDIAMQDRMMVSPQAWRTIDKPRLAKILKTLREINPDILFYFHTDGDMEEVLPDLIEIGFDMINPIQPECMDVAYIKREYGKRFTLHGTISIQETLPHGTLADVRKEVESRVALAKEDGGIILAPSNHVQHDTPLDNVIEIYKAAGSYQE